MQGDLFIDHWVVGGPAVRLMPDFLRGIKNVHVNLSDLPGVLQRVNPQATRTTVGCPRRCEFCGIGKRLICGDFYELPDWPDLPVITDDNLLAASDEHFNRVIDRLIGWGWADFNQGLDARLLTPNRAHRIAEIGEVTVRLALDSVKYSHQWRKAFKMLRNAGIAKSNIRTYVLIGFDSGPDEAWNRCNIVENEGVIALPMWFHELNALKQNKVTARQMNLGWNDLERRRIMQWYYWHKEVVR